MRNRTPAAEIAIFLTLVLCYAYFFPRWADPNQNSRLDMVVAVVEDGTFQIDKYVVNTVDYAKVEGHYYSDKAPGAAFLGIPVYAILKVVLDQPVLQSLTSRLANSAAFQSTLREGGTGVLEQKVRFALAQVALAFVAAVLPSAVLGVLLFYVAGWFTSSLPVRLLVTMAYSLLTPAFPYSGAFYGHQLSAALLFSAFTLAASAKPIPSVKRLLVIGFFLGYALISEYPSFLIVVILSGYISYRLISEHSLLKLGWLMLGGAAVAAGWMAYNHAVFGGLLQLGYSESELWQVQHHTGFMSLTLPRLDALWGVTFSPFRGLFLLSPWLLVCFPGFGVWYSARIFRAEFWAALASIMAMFLFNISSIMWWGGFAIGPRYLLPGLPFMVLAALFFFNKWGKNAWVKMATAVSLIWSSVAVWGLTLAEQAFPPDTIKNPLLEYALPNWAQGNIARNLGTIFGLQGVASLAPLFILLMLIWVIWGWRQRMTPIPNKLDS